MATVSIWAGVAVNIQSALGAVKTISAITKANPGVVTSTSHGFANGTYVVHNVQGMSQLDGRVFRVANQAANTYELEGEDTTLYGTFSSGTALAVTYGTSMTNATGLSAGGGDFDFIDTTTIHVDVKTQIPGSASAATYTFETLWDPADAGSIAMKAASDQKALRAIQFIFANGKKVVFNGYVGFAGLPTGTAQDKVISPATITMFGRPTLYAT